MTADAPDVIEKSAPRLDPTDRIVAAYDAAFQGIMVDGIDLASANRLSFFVALQTGQDFAAPTLRRRLIPTLLAYAVFLRNRLRTASTPAPLPPAARRKLLFFFEGSNPSVDSTLRSVIERFGPEEARAVVPSPEAVGKRTDHEWIAVSELGAACSGGTLAGVAGAIRRRQRHAAEPILRRRSLHAWLLRLSLRTARAAAGFRRLYEAYPASALITASDTGFWGRCATFEAARRSVPSLTLQHGMMVGGTGYVPVLSNRFAAWGRASSRWLRERGVPAEKIVVTGAPRLDAILERDHAPRGALARALALDPAARWVVLATNPIPFAQNAAQLEAARAGVAAWDPTAVLLVKIHPSEDPAAYRAAAGADARVVVVPHGGVDLYDLLKAADAVLTFHSSVGLEAMMLDRPVVSLEAFGEPNPLPYARDGAAALARNPEELARALFDDVAPGANAAARRAARKRFLQENLAAVDGKSTERVCDLIRSMARSGP